ncbi:MAG: hypothetical protein LUE10_08980 [Alistipes sp.]|nr:hypothetical protein [Alistipes sp.]
MELSDNGPAPEISFRPWTLQDTERLALLADDADVARNLRDGFPHPYPERDAGNFISMGLVHQPPGNFAVMGGGEVAGGAVTYPATTYTALAPR